LRSAQNDRITAVAERLIKPDELQPNGYKVRAQIMDFPGGMPGDVGIFLRR